MSPTARVHRTDFAGSATKVTRTPQGGLRLDAAITRVGVLTYHDTTGKTWREYKPAEEVFKADSLATLEGAPVTELHPEKLVDAASWKSVSVGHLIGAPRRDGDFVVASVAVQDSAVAGRVEARELHDVSAGYTCRVDWTAGVTPDGERYDAVQRDIVYNHAALGPEGWGRAGSEVSLRLDGAAEQVRGVAAPRSTMPKKLKIRGREYKLDADDEMKAAQDAVDEQATAADSLAAKLEAAQAALTTAVGELASLRAKMEAEEKAEPKPVTEDMVSEEVADSLVSKRLALRERARKVLGPDVKLDGLKAAAIHKLVVEKALPAVKLDSLDAKTVEGMFVAACEGATASTTARADALRAAHPGAPANTERTDGDEHLLPRDALNRSTHNRFDNRGVAAEKV